MELKQKGRRVLSAETTEPSSHIDKAAARSGGVLYAGLLLDRFLSFRCPVIIIGDIGRAFYVVQISLAIQQHKSTRGLRRGQEGWHSRKETDKRLVGRITAEESSYWSFAGSIVDLFVCHVVFFSCSKFNKNNNNILLTSGRTFLILSWNRPEQWELRYCEWQCRRPFCCFLLLWA